MTVAGTKILRRTGNASYYSFRVLLCISASTTRLTTYEHWSVSNDRAWSFVTLIYLNGEGAPRNLQRARAALEVGLKEDPNSITYHRLEDALRTCERNSARSCRLVACNI